MTELQEGLRQAVSSTSWLWDHLSIEQGSQDNMFNIVGDVDVHICGGGAHEHSDAVAIAANAKCAARKAVDWLVNGESGLKSVIESANTYLSDRPFTNEGFTQYMGRLGHYATVFMMTRKQFRSIRNDLIHATPDNRPTLFGRHVVINDYIDYESQEIWGLNLWDGVHLLETEEGIRKQDGTLRVLWDIALGYKFSTDVTVMRQV